MKNIFILLIIFVAITGSLYGQNAESFDIINYKTPKGWQKQVSQNSVQMGVENFNGGICFVTIFKSVTSSVDSKANFEAAWESIVKRLVTVNSEPQLQPSITENGWTAESGFAQYESEGKKGLVLLVTITGNGKMVNILTLTNTEAFQIELNSLIESIKLPKIEDNNKSRNESPTRTTIKQTPENSVLTNQLWKNTQNRKDGIGNYGGYSSNTYKFNNDGTYKFSNVSFQNFSPKFQIVDEEGTYQINGNEIIVSPKKSYFHVHQSEKTDPPIKSGNLSLETVKYTSIYNRSRLILSPTNGLATKRDGAFNYYANGKMNSSYLYDAQ